MLKKANKYKLTFFILSFFERKSKIYKKGSNIRIVSYSDSRYYQKTDGNVYTNVTVRRHWLKDGDGRRMRERKVKA